MKHSSEGLDKQSVTPPPAPDAAAALFGDQLPLVQRYALWLVRDGVERGIIGPREGERIWERHLINSAALAGFIPLESQVLDIGSGGGLPGVVLAIMDSTSTITLLEPMKRRVDFLEMVVDDLALANVTVVRGRAEDHTSDLAQSFDVATARAVASLDRLAAWAIPLVKPGGKVLALKGSAARQELQEASATLDSLGISTRTVHEVEVAGTVTQVVDLPVGARTSRQAARRAR